MSLLKSRGPTFIVTLNFFSRKILKRYFSMKNTKKGFSKSQASLGGTRGSIIEHISSNKRLQLFEVIGELQSKLEINQCCVLFVSFFFGLRKIGLLTGRNENVQMFFPFQNNQAYENYLHKTEKRNHLRRLFLLQTMESTTKYAFAFYYKRSIELVALK